MTAAKRGLRVVRIIDRLVIGGPTRNVVFLTEGLETLGFECTLISGVPSRGEGDMSSWAEQYGVETVKIGEMSREISWRDINVAWKIFVHLQRLQPDVVHTHKSKAGAVGRVAAVAYKWMSNLRWRKRREIKVVHTFHGHIFHSYYSPLKTKVFLFIERTLARITDCIVTVSEQQKREIRDEFGVGRHTRFCVIPLGIEFSDAADPARFRRAAAIPRQTFLLGAVGRLCEIKNFGLLINSLSKLVQEHPDLDVRLAIVGDGHLRPDLERHVDRLGLQGRVLFTGFRSDLDSIYSSIDVAVLSSLNEGTPLTLLEAMSQGRPVLTTEVGGYADILGNLIRSSEGFRVWDHGISVTSGDADGFARAITFLTENTSLREAMGKQAQAFVRQNFSRSRLVRDVADLYLELCAVPKSDHELVKQQVAAAHGS